MRLWRQFKPFVYLNCPVDRAANEKGPAFRRGLPHYWFPNLGLPNPGLPGLLVVLPGLPALLLAGPVALALRILLLLSGFLAATPLLTGVLVLLARILVLLLRHFGKLPCWTSEWR